MFGKKNSFFGRFSLRNCCRSRRFYTVGAFMALLTALANPEKSKQLFTQGGDFMIKLISFTKEKAPDGVRNVLNFANSKDGQRVFK